MERELKTETPETNYEDNSFTFTRRFQNGDCFQVRFGRTDDLRKAYQIDITEIYDGNWGNSKYFIDERGTIESGTREGVSKGSDEIERGRSQVNYLLGHKQDLIQMLEGARLPRELEDHPIKGTLTHYAVV